MAELISVLRDQKSGHLLTASEGARVLRELAKLAGGRPLLPKPVTLEKANLLELDRKTKEGHLLRREDVEQAWGGAVNITRTRLLGVASTARQRIPHLETFPTTQPPLCPQRSATTIAPRANFQPKSLFP
jgi:hypothetical protein